MTPLREFLILIALLSLPAGCIIRADASLNFTKGMVDPKLGTELTELYVDYVTTGDALGPVEEQNIALDIAFTTPIDKESAKMLLSPIIEVDYIECVGYLCSVRVPVSVLAEIASLNSVHFLRAIKAAVNAGLVNSEGDKAMFASAARKKYAVNGNGLLIGVLSDSYNCRGGAATNIRSNDLPNQSGDIPLIADLDILECMDKNKPGTDEGRAMMQLIHDVAPGARLAFRTAWRGEPDFATGILQLAAIGCDVIVDDITYFAEPMFQDGIVSQAVDTVVLQGVAYFSSAGNFGRRSWVASSGFKPVYVNDLLFHQFGTDRSGSPIVSMDIHVQADGKPHGFVFQWDEAFFSTSGAPGSRSDVDIYLIVGNTIVARSEDYNIGRDPIEYVEYVPPKLTSGSTVTVELRIVLSAGPPPKYMKLLARRPDTFEFATFSSTSFGHSNSALGAGVGAANYNNTPAFGVSPPLIEPSSSAGGTPIFFYPNGMRRSKAVVRKQPYFTGPDGAATTFFDQKFPDGKYRFFGTSASAPHVAAVAALMLQLRGGRRSLKPSKIYSLLAQTATDMDDPSTKRFDKGFDFGTGAGFVNAAKALDAVAELNLKT